MDIEQPVNSSQPSMEERYKATMLLAAVGDAIGYRGGAWQFNFNGNQIHQQLMDLTSKQGIKGLHVDRDEFPYSDDTVMHIATAKGLLQSQPQQTLDFICSKVAKHYKQCMNLMSGRAPGSTCIRSCNILQEDGSNWKDIPFQKNGGGCGASMRAACIGLYYYNDMQKLIEISIETGRTTHHNPLGYLGALVAALFTAFAVQGIHPYEWLKLLLQQYLPRAQQYIRNNREAEANLDGGDWAFFVQCWIKFATLRNMSDENPTPTFPENYGVKQREQQYSQFSVNGWGGALGVDSVIIAYDALLSTLDFEKKEGQKGVSVNRWEEVCLRGMLHGGDNDSTGTIVGAWYGALYGFRDVFKQNYQNSEDKEQIQQLGLAIYKKVYGNGQANNQNLVH